VAVRLRGERQHVGCFGSRPVTAACSTCDRPWSKSVTVVGGRRPSCSLEPTPGCGGAGEAKRLQVVCPARVGTASGT